MARLMRVVAALVAVIGTAAWPAPAAAQEVATFSASSPTVSESAGSATVTITYTCPSQGGSTGTVAYATADGSATAGSDYTSQNGTVVFSAPGSQTVSIPILNDSVNEATETFAVNLSNPTTDGCEFEGSATTSNGTVTITDDDVAPTTTTTSTTTTTIAPTTTTTPCTPAISLSQTSFPWTGGTTDVVACGYSSATTGGIYVLSEPVLVSTGTADAAGVIRGTVTIPSGLARGPHDVEVRGQAPGGGPRVLRAGITIGPRTVVRGTRLAATGPPAEPGTLQLATVVGAAGLALMATARRRSTG